MNKWFLKEKFGMSSPMVTISCITYNHEKYISKAIESFLMQKTDFPFEIVIHDDASTDKTPDIIRSYQKKYPNKIKTVLQTENQYSQGTKRIAATFIWPIARGKYIASCEGDDYWNDPYKLQRQIKFMEDNPDCILCLHATKINYQEAYRGDAIRRPNEGNKYFDIEEVIIRGAHIGHTSSQLFRSEVTKQLPAWYFESPTGDTPLKLICATKGNIYYIDKIMSVHRKGLPSSWTQRIQYNSKTHMNHFYKTLQMLDNFNEYTHKKYQAAIKHRKGHVVKRTFLLHKRAMSNEEVLTFKKYLSEENKISKFLILNSPFFYRVVTKIYREVKNFKKKVSRKLGGSYRE